MNPIIKMLSQSLIFALREYAKGTKTDIDDKAVDLVESILKYLKLI